MGEVNFVTYVPMYISIYLYIYLYIYIYIYTTTISPRIRMPGIRQTGAMVEAIGIKENSGVQRVLVPGCEGY